MKQSSSRVTYALERIESYILYTRNLVEAKIGFSFSRKIKPKRKPKRKKEFLLLCGKIGNMFPSPRLCKH